jgi:hypothetical protein
MKDKYGIMKRIKLKRNNDAQKIKRLEGMVSAFKPVLTNYNRFLTY